MYEYDSEDKEDDLYSQSILHAAGRTWRHLETMNPEDVLAYQYDIVCNGVELSSGAVRNHDMKIMVKAFEIAGYDRRDI